MSLKLKLTSTIAAFMLILGLTIIGVFAAPTATIQLGGSLNFKATDVHAKVTGVIAGTKVDPQPTLTDLVFEAGVNTDVSSWANVPLQFTDAGSEITITVTIENLATDRPLYATLEDAVGEVTNVTKSMKKGADAYTGDVIELPASTGTGTSTAVITLSMKVTNPNASIADDATYGYSIELNNEEPEIITEEEIDGLHYTYSIDEATDAKTAIVEAGASFSATSVNIPNTITSSDNVTYTVTSIADGAFQYQENIQSVTLPSSVTSIGESAFEFAGLQSINLSNVESIGYAAFWGCSKLQNADLSNVTSLGNSVFSGCTGLTEVILSQNITNIGEDMFCECSNLVSINLSNVTSIGTRAFYNCSSLQMVELSSLETIGDDAFCASGLVELILPESVISIGIAFSDCTNLTNLTIQNLTLDMLPDELVENNTSCRLFAGCPIQTLIVEKGVIPACMFGCLALESFGYYEASTLTKVILGDEVTSIGDYAFEEQEILAKVAFGIGLESIGEYAFNGAGVAKLYYDGSLEDLTVGEYNDVLYGVQQFYYEEIFF